MHPDEIADAHQQRLIAISTAATNRALSLWRQMDFTALDASWNRIEPALTQRVDAAQLTAAKAADTYTAKLSSSYGFAADDSRIIPESFVGVDGSGRSTSTLLRGSVTTTKEAIGAGLGRREAMHAGAVYLTAMLKTALADLGRSADLTSSAGKGYTRYVRVVEPGACSRCIILAGATQFRPFKRHPACRCTCQPLPKGQDFGKSPEEIFEEMSDADQDRVFGKAGAQALRDGADMNQVVSARRGAKGIGYSYRTPTGAQWNRMQKTTIGFRPDGAPVRVYTTTEGATARGQFGRTSAGRVRLMPESIIEIAGDDTALRQAFLRDAGYLQYRPRSGYSVPTSQWTREIEDQRRADRILVNRATLRYGNFTLG